MKKYFILPLALCCIATSSAQSNNAPSIDLGNPYTEVNFRGGQIEMQNAQIVSDNYKTTLAISIKA